MLLLVAWSGARLLGMKSGSSFCPHVRKFGCREKLLQVLVDWEPRQGSPRSRGRPG